MKHGKTIALMAGLTVTGFILAWTQGGFNYTLGSLLKPERSIKALAVEYWWMSIPFLYITFVVASHLYGEGYKEIDLTD